ncbi:MAG: small-conductance mechanosensitive channel protein [Gallionellaceae bacterium]|nr:MAG: small-conductance mechanosensitive channel protein [Gallionellaceae bacterium]
MFTDLTPDIIRLLLVLAGTVLAHFFVGRALKRAEDAASHTENIWDDALISAAKKPLPALIWLSGLSFALHLVHRQTGEQLLDYLSPARNIGFILCVSWFLFKLIREAADKAIALRPHVGGAEDRTTVDGLSKIGRIVVVVLAALMVMQTLGFSISGVLAFGGVGGIAVGFAAKDLLANLFGGLMVHLDRPFNIGEKIRSPDREIEGIVEHIGWRQTSIRANNMALLFVPNSLFTSIVVENTSRISHRRIEETIGLRYQDLDKVTVIATEIEQMLKIHPEIDPEQNVIVALSKLAESSLDLTLLAFTRSGGLPQYHQIRQDVLLKVSDIVLRHEADFAFPTRTLLQPA